jgi:superfamily II DNA or RNA helicase
MSHKTVHIRVDNRVARLVSRYNYDKLIPYWSFSVSSYIYMNKPWYRKCKICKRPQKAHPLGDEGHRYEPIWDGKIKLLQRDRVPSGLFWATYKEIEKKEHIKFQLHVHTKHVELNDKEKKWIWSKDKYAFQNECVDDIVYNITQLGRGGLVLNATGSGKTRVFAMVASRLDCELLFIVDQLNLLDQARKDIAKHLGEKVGKVGESKFKLRRVTVATIQTLALHKKDTKFLKWFENVEVIFIDELHTMLNKSNFDVIKIAKPLATIGLTATLGLSQKPVRLKAFSLTGPVLYEYPILKGMKDNVLSKGIGISFLYNNHITNIEGYTAQEAYDEKIVRNSERNWLIAHVIMRAHKLGKYIICIVDRLKHLEKLSLRLEAKGIKHKIVSGSYKGKGVSVVERVKSVKRFERGDIRVILANKVMKKGVDVKRVDCVINATGRKSKNDAIQIFGRGVRTHEDKSGLIYIDVSDMDNNNNKSSGTKNWFQAASKSRIRALRKIGITIKKVRYVEEEDIKVLFSKANKWLQQEIKR